MKTRLLLITALALSLTPAVTRAANQTVDNLGDTGLSSQLRQKIAACQSGTNPGGTITFSVAGTITLDPTKGPLPTITTNVTVNGGGTIEISGNHIAGDTGTRIFNVNDGAILTLNNLTISHGYSANGDGGAVSNFGTLNVNKSRFFSSETSPSWSGSAILSWGPLNITGSEIAYNNGGGGAVKPRSSGALTSITNCNFHHNTSTDSAGGGYGGAMQLHDAPHVTVTGSTFSHNSAGQEGGAVYVNSSSTFVADNSSFTANSAASEGGGAISSSYGQVRLTKSTLSGNSAPSYGGAILSFRGTLYLSSVTLSSNKSLRDGGAVDNYLGTATLTNVTLSSNSAAGGGGGIYSDGDATLTNVTVTGNSGRTGGGIYKYSGTAILTDVTVSGNSSVGINDPNSTDPDFGGDGGGIFVFYDTTNLTNVTISGNSANYEGGGIFNYPGTSNLTNVTVSGNSASMSGGGIFHAGTGTLTNVTISGNSAPSGGGISSSNANLTVKNTLINKGANGENCAGFTVGGQNNLSNDKTCGFGTGDDVQNLLLGPLANNGGVTMTHLPQAGSAAIDSGTGDGAPTVDQRGVTRPQLAGFDVGAVEYLPLVDSTSANIQYDGWRGIKNASASGGFYRISNVTNDSVTYIFKGNSIKWTTRKGPDMGVALVTIDGVNRGTYDLYSASILWKQQLLFDGLATSSHTIVIQVTGKKNANATDYNVALDGFQVGSATTTVQENAISMQYNNWAGKSQTAAIGGSYRSNGTLGSMARFSFLGSSISFVTARGPSYGYVNVYIDGLLKSSDIDLYSATQQWQYTLQYSGLTNANHTMEVRPTNSKNAKSKGYAVVVDAFTGPFTTLP